MLPLKPIYLRTMKIRYRLLSIGIALLFFLPLQAQKKATPQPKVWSAAKANTWYAGHKWINGANFTPSTAINQLEMWQTDTFDPETIDRELGYAEGIGFNTMRVFLHSIAWKEDPKGFKQRINKYLDIADKHHIQPCLYFWMIAGTPMPNRASNRNPKPVSIIQAGCRTPATG